MTGPLFRQEVIEAQARGLDAGEPLDAVASGGRFGDLLRRVRPRRVPFVPQMEISDCGAACVAMALAYHGRTVDLAEVRHVSGTDREGVDALDLSRTARWFGLRARGLRMEPDDLDRLEPGSILHWDLNHFVVLERVTRHGAIIVDPASGRRRVGDASLRRSFTGVALEITTGSAFERGGRRARGGQWRYLLPVLRRPALLGGVVGASALIQVFALALPILTGLVVDRVVPEGNRSLLLTLTVGLLAMASFHVIASYARGRQLLSLRTRVDLQMSLRFIEHMADLPYAFFLQRSTGDLMMRLNSNTTVREILTASVLSGVLDGFTVLIYLVVILARSTLLGSVVLAVGAAQVAVLLLSRQRYQRLMAENLTAQSRSQSFLAQMLAGMETLKVAGGERRAVESWSNLFVRELNVSVQRGRLSAVVEAALGGIRVAGPVLILGVGAAQVLDHRLSLGTMLGLSALAAGFLLPLGTLVGNGLQLASLGSYLARINDVLDTPREQEGIAVEPAGVLTGRVTVENVSFAYGPLSAEVLRDVSLELAAGGTIAIVGRSGSGKSTLAGIILGLHQPSAGRVLHDGRDLALMEARSVREQVGFVPQVPYLFGSSIRDNIALNDATASLEDVRAAARMACIDADIMALGMGYDTVLADGGASLSGGQRQRIALARALLRKPALLVLDEATSELDSITEAEVVRNLATLKCTRVLIAHRLSTISDADQIIVMDGGTVVQRGSHRALVRRRGIYRELVALQGLGT